MPDSCSSDGDAGAPSPYLSERAAGHAGEEPGGQVNAADFLLLRQLALDHPDGSRSPSMVLLSDLLAANLAEIHADFVSYYGLDPQAVMYQMVMAFQWAVQGSTPEVIAAAAERGVDWGIHICEVVKITVWVSLYSRYLDTDALDDHAFRALFEAEWARLMPYRGLRYNFRVVPRLSLNAFVRYQELRRGNSVIRQIISSYLAHEGKHHPHFIEHWAPLFGEVAFARRLRRIYEPLIRLTARHALDNIEASGADRERLLPDMLEQVRDAFDKAWEAFEFHVAYRGQPSPWGRRGILGLAEDPGFRETFDNYLQNEGAEELGLVPLSNGAAGEGASVDAGTGDGPVLVSTDLTPVLFSVFLRRRLIGWLQSTYPRARQQARTQNLEHSLEALGTKVSHPGRSRLGDHHSDAHHSGDHHPDDRSPEDDSPAEATTDASGWNMGDNAIVPEVPAVFAPDGTRYWTVEQAARRCGATVRQLRYADRRGRLKALRAGQVSGAAYVQGGVPPNPDLRLYPATDAMDTAARLVLARVAARAGDLTGEELTRTAAASLLDVSVDTLRSLEASGRIMVQRRGRTVVYTAQAIQQARKELTRRRS